MSKELYIGGKQIELSDANVALTFQANDITKPESIQSNFSNQFKVPRTKPNEEALESVADVQSLSNLPYEKLVAKFVQDGYELVSGGYAVIDKADKNFYYTTIYSGFAEFFKLIDGKKLRDLNFGYPMGSFNYDIATMTALSDESILLTPALPIFFPVNDYGSLTSGASSTIDIRFQYPAVWARHIIKKIITDVGFTPIGNFFTDKLMDELYLPFSNGQPVHSPEWMESLKFKAVKTAPQFIPGNGSVVDQRITFPDISVLGFDNGSNWAPSTSIYVGSSSPIGNKKARFKISIRVQWDDTNTNNSGTISITDSAAPFNDIYSEPISAPTGVGVVTDHSIDTGLISFQNNVWVSLNNLFGNLSNATVLEGSVECVEGDTVINVGSKWEIEPNLPDMEQKDFVKDLLYLSHTIPVIDAYNKTIDFRYFEDLYINKGRAKDWSDKHADISKSIKAFRIPNLAQKNYLKWKKNDTDGIADDYGQGTLPVNDATLNPEKTYYEMHFAASLDVVRLGNLHCCYIKTDNQKKTTPRLLRAQFRNYTASITMTDGTNSLTTILKIAESKFEQLLFANIIETYYRNMKDSMFVKSKFIKEVFNLKEVDVYEFDHLIPVYLHQYNDYFYVNKIENFKANSLTTVELIRL